MRKKSCCQTGMIASSGSCDSERYWVLSTRDEGMRSIAAESADFGNVQLGFTRNNFDARAKNLQKFDHLCKDSSGVAETSCSLLNYARGMPEVYQTGA